MSPKSEHLVPKGPGDKDDTSLKPFILFKKLIQIRFHNLLILFV